MLYTSTVDSPTVLAYLIALTEKCYLLWLSPLAGSQQEDMHLRKLQPSHLVQGLGTNQLCGHPAAHTGRRRWEAPAPALVGRAAITFI